MNLKLFFFSLPLTKQKPQISFLLVSWLGILGAHGQLTIMPLGDSITKGGGIGNDGTVGAYYLQSGYRSELYTDLSSDNISFTFQGATTTHTTAVLTAAGEQYHNGFGSYTLGDIYQNLAGTTASSNPEGGDYNEGGYWLTGGNGTGRSAEFPDVVLLMGGTNDINAGENLATVETNMNDILSWFYTNRPDSKLIVSTVIPFAGSGYAVQDAEITAFNSWLVDTELPSFSRYQPVDMNALFTANESNYYSTDNVHPNAEGYNAMGDLWASTIEADVAPEPDSFWLLLVGLLPIAWTSRQRRHIHNSKTGSV